MDTNEKIEKIIEKLIVKTRENLCAWKYQSNNKFKLVLGGGTIYLSATEYSDGILYVVLDIFNHSNINTPVASIKKQKDGVTDLAILYTLVCQYHKEYVDDYIQRLIKEIDSLYDDGSDFLKM